jgi:hypothetical protein
VQDLSLQVVHGHTIVIQEAEPSHAGGGKIQRRRRAKPAKSNDQHRGRAQSLLTLSTDVRQCQVTRVALQFIA